MRISACLQTGRNLFFHRRPHGNSREFQVSEALSCALTKALGSSIPRAPCHEIATCYVKKTRLRRSFHQDAVFLSPQAYSGSPRRGMAQRSLALPKGFHLHRSSGRVESRRGVFPSQHEARAVPDDEQSESAARSHPATERRNDFSHSSRPIGRPRDLSDSI